MGFLLFQLLRRDLTNAVMKKCPEVAKEELLIHQNSAPSHRATGTLMPSNFLG